VTETIVTPGRIFTPPYKGDLWTTFPCCSDRISKLWMEPGGKRNWFRRCRCGKQWNVNLLADGRLSWTEAPERKRR
jgi:hypothetical protein